MTMSQELDSAVEIGLIEESKLGHRPAKFKRTQLGDVFLRTLEPDLAVILDEMPMSGGDLLDFLSML